MPWAGREDQWRDVVPAWLRSRDTQAAAARWVVRHSWHVTAYHTVRTPTYALRLAGRAPAGAGRLLAHTARWAVDVESKPVRDKAARDADATDYLRVSNQHRELVKHRTILLVVVGIMAGILAAVLVETATTAGRLLLAAVALGGLGLVGRRPDKPVVDHAVITPRARRLTADVVTRAFVGAGLCKDDNPIAFPAPIARDGDGWRAVVDLPHGKTADQAIKKRVEIASGLDLDEVQVWPERVRGTTGSARRVALWVADEDPYAKPSGTWPWAAAKTTVSLFDPFPFGLDQRGRPVTMTLMFTWLLVGAVPRMGKTYAARLAALAAGLDPHVQLHVYDGKGGADWRPFERIAHRFGLGAREETVTALLADLRELKTDMDRRYDQLGRLPVDRCPEGKVTAALATDHTLGLHPVVVAVDEFQRYSAHPTHGDEIVDLLTELAKVGPAAGIMGVLATQKPDPDSVPTRLRDVIGTRYALKVMNYHSSDAVLGAGAYTA
ncbi:MAG: cell division protein FtsK, partial [Micromonosporaceae bacterium]